MENSASNNRAKVIGTICEPIKLSHEAYGESLYIFTVNHSISKNVQWGWRQRIAAGKVSMAYGQFLGYEKCEDRKPKIVESEARMVHKIYRMFLEGKTASYIANYLTEQGVPTPGHNKKC